MTDQQLAEPDREQADHRRRPRALLVGLGLVVVLVATGAFWLLSFDAPDAVDIGSAVGQVDTSDAAGTTADDDGTVTADGDAWTVDTSIGEFSISDSTGTFVGVRVDEELSNIGATTAVVRTPAVSGTINLDDTTLAVTDIEADFTALVSDESRREDAVQRALRTSANPTATFTLTDPVELGALPTADTPVEVVATGDLTINGATNSVDVPLQVAMVDDVAVVTGTFDITFADYDVQAPSAPIVLSVDDSGTVELQLFLTQQVS